VIDLSIKINFSIEDNKLKTEVVYPEAFLLENVNDRLIILYGIVKLTERSVLPDNFELKGTLEENHNSLVREAKGIFPCSMYLVVKEEKDHVLNVDFNYGKTVHSIHNEHLFVLIDGLISNLNSSIVFIINNTTEKKTSA